MATVIKTRCRRYGLTEAQARQPLAGSAIGRLCLAGEITRAQHDAALRYLEARKDYHSAIMAKSDAGSGGAAATGDVVTDTYAAWCRRARERWAAINEMLDDLVVAIRSPAPRAALDTIAVRDVDLPELVGDLRAALNALDRYFAGDRRRAA